MQRKKKQIFHLVEHIKQPDESGNLSRKNEIAVCSVIEQDVHIDPPRKRVRPPARPKRRSGS